MFEDHSRRTFLATLGALTASGVAGTSLADSHSTTEADRDATTGWTQFRAGPERTGAVESESAPGGEYATRRWVAATNEDVLVSEPVVGDGAVYRPYLVDDSSYRAGVVAFEADTGEQRWKAPDGDSIGRVTTAPVVGDGRLYVTSHSGSGDWEYHETASGLHAFDTQTGEVVWQNTTAGGGSPDVKWNGPILYADGTLYVSHVTNASADPEEQSSTVDAIDPATGEVQWRTDASYLTRVIGASQGTLYGMATHLDAANELVAWDADDGTTLWSTTVEDGVNFLDSAIASDAVFRSTGGPNYDGPNQVVAHDTADGSVRWQTNLTGEGDEPQAYIGAPAVADGSIYVFTATNDASERDEGVLSTVYALDAETGEMLWTHDTSTELHGDPSVAGDTVYLGGNALPKQSGGAEVERRYPTVHALSAADGTERWAYLVRETGDLIKQTYRAISAETPTLADGRVYASRNMSGDGTDGMFALEASDVAPDAENLPRTSEAPIARIVTDPEDAESMDLDSGTTVGLDGTASTGDVETYEWQFGEGAPFSETGATTDVTLDFCGTLDVTLRVTGPDGQQSSDTVSLSTDG